MENWSFCDMKTEPDMCAKIVLLFVIGTRPEAIKLAPIIMEAQKYPERYKVFVCNTGQHTDMLDQTCKSIGLEFGIKLEIEDKSSLSKIASILLDKLHDISAQTTPDWIVTQGDTTSAFIGGLVGFYNKIKVAHIEAGLRSFNNMHPFPEEVHRKLLATFATSHFVPTMVSKFNLLKENINPDTIFVTGNTVIDTIRIISHNMMEYEKILFEKYANFLDRNKKIILITSHRRENHGIGLHNICAAIKKLSESKPDFQFVFPVHHNHNVQSIVRNSLNDLPNVFLLDPLDYTETIALIKNSYLILTDSGGLQEEASAFCVPVLVLRETTERIEGIECGISKIVGTNTENIISSTLEILENNEKYDLMSKQFYPYGDGFAAQKILEKLL